MLETKPSFEYQQIMQTLSYMEEAEEQDTEEYKSLIVVAQSLLGSHTSS